MGTRVSEANVIMATRGRLAHDVLQGKMSEATLEGMYSMARIMSSSDATASLRCDVIFLQQAGEEMALSERRPGFSL